MGGRGEGGRRVGGGEKGGGRGKGRNGDTGDSLSVSLFPDRSCVSTTMRSANGFVFSLCNRWSGTLIGTCIN